MISAWNLLWIFPAFWLGFFLAAALSASKEGK